MHQGYIRLEIPVIVDMGFCRERRGVGLIERWAAYRGKRISTASGNESVDGRTCGESGCEYSRPGLSGDEIFKTCRRRSLPRLKPPSVCVYIAHLTSPVESSAGSRKNLTSVALSTGLGVAI